MMLMASAGVTVMAGAGRIDTNSLRVSAGVQISFGIWKMPISVAMSCSPRLADVQGALADERMPAIRHGHAE